MGLLCATSGALGYDLARPPAEQYSARYLVAWIHGYQAVLSPGLAVLGARCRFSPTCSRYAEASIKKYGAAKGVGRSLWRLLRCGPWTAAGTIDPA